MSLGLEPAMRPIDATTPAAGGTHATVRARLRLEHVSKTFAGRTVLRDVSLTVRPGELHGIVGQNGSGKSTLAKVISGYHAPDPGAAVLVDGEALALPPRISDLRRVGVSVVYQDLGLIRAASVVENVRIGAMRGRPWTGRVDWAREERAARAALDRLGFRGSLRAKVADLVPADRARVAIARALQDHQDGKGLILFDESTRALPADALDDFYAIVRQLLSEGTAALMIGHRLGEILTHCDTVSALRDGALVIADRPAATLDEGELARSMLGRRLADLRLSKRATAPTPQVRVRGLDADGLAEPLSLELSPGEVIGLTGLPGSGFEQVPALLAGAADARGGTLELDGDQLDLVHVRVAQMVRRGVVLVPEDRLQEGLSIGHSVRDNVTLPWLTRHGRPWAAGGRWRAAQTRTVIDELDVRPADPEQMLGRLSGGNQQKVLLGKWLAGSPRLLLLNEPTQAVDVAARQDIVRAIHRVAEAGTPVLVASTEVADLSLLCHRILVFRDGRVHAELAGDADEASILAATYARPPEPTHADPARPAS
jgi:ribose transport system ATP-binding protein